MVVSLITTALGPIPRQIALIAPCHACNTALKVERRIRHLSAVRASTAQYRTVDIAERKKVVIVASNLLMSTVWLKPIVQLIRCQDSYV